MHTMSKMEGEKRFAQNQKRSTGATGEFLVTPAETTLVRPPDITHPPLDSKSVTTETSEALVPATRPTAIQPEVHELTQAVNQVLSVENQQLQQRITVFE